MVFLGKTDPQDTYILFDGHELVLTRSIRRISTVWRGHLPFHMNFRCWSWEYKTGFGGRIVPTRAQSGALTASFSAPTGKVEPSAFFDEDAEAVRQNHLEEVREDIELTEMMVHDKTQQPEAITAPEAGEPVDDGPKRMQFPTQLGSLTMIVQKVNNSLRHLWKWHHRLWSLQALLLLQWDHNWMCHKRLKFLKQYLQLQGQTLRPDSTTSSLMTMNPKEQGLRHRRNKGLIESVLTMLQWCAV